MLSLLRPSDADIWCSLARGSVLLIKAGCPVRRMLQKRFAEGSRRAMLRAASGEPEY